MLHLKVGTCPICQRNKIPCEQKFMRTHEPVHDEDVPMELEWVLVPHLDGAMRLCQGSGMMPLALNDPE